ncbi:DEAD/DEAH box helicase [Candidatus Woesearchaeota archaeon]|nr:MAG: DEAD/DEAH box helicase [Candidatus Woesearchaeota archaeon]
MLGATGLPERFFFLRVCGLQGWRWRLGLHWTQGLKSYKAAACFFLMNMLLKDFSARLYQETILATCTLHNTLVVLPTGLGKTGVALLLAAHRLENYPDSKVVFLAPTKPLVQQHVETFRRHLLHGEELCVLFTGTVTPSKRAELWKSAKVVVSTPQGLENDLVSRKVSLKNVSLLIFDEAHRARGDYAYTFIAKRYRAEAEHERILGLTASPGDSVEAIKEVVKNLFIEEVEVRTPQDPDVKPYVQEREVKVVKVEFPRSFGEVRKHLREGVAEKLREVKELGVVQRVSSNMTKKQLLDVSRSLFARMSKGEKSRELMRSVSLLAEAIKFEHCIELLETQGVRALYTYMREAQEKSSTSKTKAVQNLVRSLHFRSALVLAERLVNEGVLDPKFVALQKALKEKKGKKGIIFTQYRDQAKRICGLLGELGVAHKLFVGQAKTRETGLSQKEQKEIIEAFHEGVFDVLVATSVAEEGLDIPEVDFVFFYEPIPSSIRTVQRRGRTGRHARGEVVVFVVKGTRDEAYHWVAHHKEKRMHRVLKEVGKVLKTASRDRPLSNFVKGDVVVSIYADHRERGSGVLRELAGLGVKVELKSLDIGDFLLSDRVVVERKEVRDFVDSLIDGRLLSQAKDLKRYARPIIVIEGEGDVFSQRNVHPNAIRGALAALAIDFGITLLQTKSPAETAQLLVAMARREQEFQGRSPRLIAGKPTSLAELQEFIVGALPGIGVKLARPLLERFGSVRGVMNASENELRAVPLIGTAKAKRIEDVLGAPYRSSQESEGERTLKDEKVS